MARDDFRFVCLMERVILKRKVGREGVSFDGGTWGGEKNFGSKNIRFEECVRRLYGNTHQINRTVEIWKEHIYLGFIYTELTIKVMVTGKGLESENGWVWDRT